jgi:hypothetical protein
MNYYCVNDLDDNMETKLFNTNKNNSKGTYLLKQYKNIFWYPVFVFICVVSVV